MIHVSWTSSRATRQLSLPLKAIQSLCHQVEQLGRFGNPFEDNDVCTISQAKDSMQSIIS
jgi:hypothetical protein